MSTRAQQIEIVGIGEHMHGELLSWTKRLELVDRWVFEGHRVLVLTDHLDYYVQGMRDQDVRFETRRVFVNGTPTCSFWPSLMPYTEYTREHYEIMRRFAALDRDSVTFYGIDVRLLDHPHLLSRTRPSMLKDLLGRQRHTWSHSHDYNNGYATGRGEEKDAERSRANAALILSMARLHPGYKVVYFAQNERVAFDCQAMRSNSVESSYVTEGAILKWSLGPLYTSVGTFAPSTYTTFWNSLSCAMQTLKKNRRMGYCIRDDFDMLFTKPESERMTPLCCSMRNMTSVPEHEILDMRLGLAYPGLSFTAAQAKTDNKIKRKCKKKHKGADGYAVKTVVKKCQKLARLVMHGKKTIISRASNDVDDIQTKKNVL